MLEIKHIESDQEKQEVKNLILEYSKFLGVDLAFQKFEDELADVSIRYASGAVLIALYDGKTAGCVCLKQIGDGISEMKRLYVKPEFRGLNIGRSLAEEIINVAREKGFKAMYLDTLESLKSALELYRSIGFIETEKYYENPFEGVVYMKLELI